MKDTNRFQNGSLTLVRNKRVADTWFFRFYEDRDGRRVYRKQRVGTVDDLPRRRDAENAALLLRAQINNESRSPETVNELIAHYSRYELTPERKAFATREGVKSYLSRHIVPKWGPVRVSDVRTVAVEEWLHSLSLAPGSKTKIRNIMSAVFTHGIRHEWFHHNPIAKVRCSAKRLREPDVLTPGEFRLLLGALPIRERASVLLAGATGLRRSELFGLRWSDVDFIAMEVAVKRSTVRSRIGAVKTDASGRPVPLETGVKDALLRWKEESMYSSDTDFIFPSLRRNGTQPLQPDMVLKRIIRPALVRVGITGKVVGWHTFRHSLATNLRSLGVDVKVAQELLRHANSRITMDIYTHAVSSEKRLASSAQVALLLGDEGGIG